MPRQLPAPDPLRRRSPFIFRAFGLYLHWYFSRHFHAVRLSRTGLPRAPVGRPLIIYSNHPSWWDPALYILLSVKLFPGRASFGPMEKVALGRYRLLERMGVFSIEPDTMRGAARFMDVGKRVLGNPNHILWITAEGAFTDARQRPILLRPGIAHLCRRIPQAVILPLAIEYSFWNESRPEALIRFGAPIDCAAVGARDVPGWRAMLEDRLSDAMDVLAAESATRDPGHFISLLRGNVGIGGIYDAWRRLAAWTSGRRFDASHQGQE